MKRIFLIGMLAIFLAACGSSTTKDTETNPSGMGGMGMGGGMMDRHHAQIPEEFASLESSVPADDESYERGAAIYATNCASCHGDGGMGDGPAGAALDPAPSPVARTSQMMGDNYLFWRISEGGVPFSSAMPAWKGTLDDQSRWDVINYVRALGAGEVKPGSGMGGAMYDPQAQAAQEAEMMKQAVEQNVITQAEAEIFSTVHAAVEKFRTENPDFAKSISDAAEREAAMLAEVVKAGTITQEQAEAFKGIHDRLGTSGLMP
jgi:mono/diheme cytochrome c family protein